MSFAALKTKQKKIIIIIIIGKVLKMDTLFGVGCDHH